MDTIQPPSPNAHSCQPPDGLRALATDFDGTLAHDGKVSETTLQGVLRLKQAGYKLIMVTGRELNDLIATFPEIHLFDLLVLENGAVLHEPATGGTQALAALPPPEFITRLIAKGMPVDVGKVIVATWEPHEAEVLAAIKELGLDLQVIFNKGAVMVVPSGVNKATGLRAALSAMGLEAAQVAGVGDAENDHAFLDMCGFPVAVANALPSIRDKVRHVTTADHGDGVVELIDCLLTPRTIQA